MNPASTIISDVKIKGTLEFSESLFLDCQFEGDIVSEGKLTIGEHGHVEGHVKAESVIVFGNVKGNIVVTNSCKIKSTATLLGDTMAPKLEIAEGAVIQGNITVPFPPKEEIEEEKVVESEEPEDEASTEDDQEPTEEETEELTDEETDDDHGEDSEDAPEEKSEPEDDSEPDNKEKNH